MSDKVTLITPPFSLRCAHYCPLISPLRLLNPILTNSYNSVLYFVVLGAAIAQGGGAEKNRCPCLGTHIIADRA